MTAAREVDALTVPAGADTRQRMRFDWFAWVDRLLDHVQKRDLTPAEQVILLRASRHATYGTGEDVRPSVATLAAETGFTERTVGPALAKGVELGLLEQVGKRGSRGRATVYRLVSAAPDYRKPASANEVPPAASPEASPEAHFRTPELPGKYWEEEGAKPDDHEHEAKPLVSADSPLLDALVNMVAQVDPGKAAHLALVPKVVAEYAALSREGCTVDDFNRACGEINQVTADGVGLAMKIARRVRAGEGPPARRQAGRRRSGRLRTAPCQPEDFEPYVGRESTAW